MSLDQKIHLRENEEILDIVYRYAFTYAYLYVIGFAFLLVASFFMFWLFAQGVWGYYAYGAAMFLGVYIIVQTWFFAKQNFLVVTNERVVDVNRRGWFDEVVSSVGYMDVDDVSCNKKGMLASLMNYGTVTIQGKSSQFALDVEKVHDPEYIMNSIQEGVEEYRTNKKVINKDAIYNSFLKLIPELQSVELDHAVDLLQSELTLRTKKETVEKRVEEKQYE